MNPLKRKLDSSYSENFSESCNKRPKYNYHWSLGLLNAMKYQENIIQSDDLVVVIKDKYPKAEFHYLVLPKEEISSLKTVTSSHLKLLKHMDEVGRKLVLDNMEKHKGRVFRFGYHAAPSMERLHLHVISDDMNSKGVKTKKHWNSFTSPFFLLSEDICKNLEKDGKVNLPSSKDIRDWLSLPLKCHKCDYYPTNIPNLKLHISTHK